MVSSLESLHMLNLHKGRCKGGEPAVLRFSVLGVEELYKEPHRRRGLLPNYETQK